MHDCGWVEGATCQQDHSLTSHPNPSLSVISQCYSNASFIFVNPLETWDLSWVIWNTLFIWSHVHTEIAWMNGHIRTQFWTSNIWGDTAHRSNSSASSHLLLPVASGSRRDADNSLQKAYSFQGINASIIWTVWQFDSSSRIRRRSPPWTSCRWPWIWPRRPPGGRWPCSPSAACARRMQPFGKVQSSVRHHRPWQED